MMADQTDLTEKGRMTELKNARSGFFRSIRQIRSLAFGGSSIDFYKRLRSESGVSACRYVPSTVK
jgi:hypothetical protein